MGIGGCLIADCVCVGGRLLFGLIVMFVVYLSSRESCCLRVYCVAVNSVVTLVG